MNFFQLIEARFSCRAYKSQGITEQQINQIIAAANLAPSAGNLQVYKILVIRDQKVKEQLVEACYQQEFLAQAPMVLAFCAVPEESGSKYGEQGRQLFAVQDATIACAYAQLAATELGLATVWVGGFEAEKIIKVLNLGPELKPIAILPIGYCAIKPEPKQRKELKEILF